MGHKAPATQQRLPFSGRTKPKPTYFVTQHWFVYARTPEGYISGLVGTILDPDLPPAAKRCITAGDLYDAVTLTGHCVPLAEVCYG